MRALATVFFSIMAIATFAQQTITWVGGTPGNERSWQESKNWSTHSVPDEDSYVIIQYLNSGHQAQPLIDGEVRVASIQLIDRASLTIETSGSLIINGGAIYTEGFVLIHGDLINKGQIALFNIDADLTTDYFTGLQNSGTVYLDNELLFYGNNSRIQKPALAKRD